MSQDIRNHSSRRGLALASVGLGAILLLLVPLYVVFNAVTAGTGATIAGTWLILSVVTGMALVAVGAALSD